MDLIYRQEATFHQLASNKNYGKDRQWVENTMKRGTLKDHIAAMSVVVSSHPVHKLYALDMLLKLAKVATGDDDTSGSKTNDRVSHVVSEALTDLFTSTLLPPNCKSIGLDESSSSYVSSEDDQKNYIESGSGPIRKRFCCHGPECSSDNVHRHEKSTRCDDYK